MNQSVIAAVKSAVAKFVPDSPRLEILCSLPKIETWRKKYVGKDCPQFSKREELYDYLQKTFVGDRAIDYLEFGVYRGESIRYWSRINQQKESRFFGFDTFTGLPETWKQFTGMQPKGAMDCGGTIPQIDDGRVQFFKGLYQDTLDPFLADFSQRSLLVIHDDSDLYSSTLYELTKCHHLLTPEVIVIFDDFSSVLNQFRALDDYCAAYRRSYNVLGVAGNYADHIAIRFA